MHKKTVKTTVFSCYKDLGVTLGISVFSGVGIYALGEVIDSHAASARLIAIKKSM